ncbi:hypothetical protein BUALT_Bualt02G0065200 [Buddleja alternifolia]|uniref:MADF domain-containing protein n=1 Tax=Buddleja alternifolia TaxID=168488 RepID=A0AAV6XXY4_9LAMI|nr:hypothetical protein BUALT_Bualt02G0065200 [Buddleja alternifolia]
MSLGKTSTETRALVTAPSMKPDALAVVPLRKSKRSESAQRHIRKPYTVLKSKFRLLRSSEPEGIFGQTYFKLIYVNKWRDVNLRAFDSAKYRNVDLKDKWKTLVHTARISPQQRRGQPVPQELHDRV